MPELILVNNEMAYNRNVFLDSIKEIKMKGTSYYEVSQNTTLDFYVDGR